MLLPGVTQASQVGQIQLVRFDNPSGLVAMGGNLFLDSFASARHSRAPADSLPASAPCNRDFWKARTSIWRKKWSI